VLRGNRRLRRRRGFEPEIQLPFFQGNRDRPTTLEPAEEDLVRQPIAYLGLNHARQRPRAEDRVVTLLREPRSSFGLERDRHATFGQLRLELENELLHDRFHDPWVERPERHDRIESIAELGAEHLFDRLFRSLLRRSLTGPALSGDAVVVGDFEGYVHFLARESGAFLARQETDGAALRAMPVPLLGSVLVQTEGGGLYALGP